MLAKNEVRSFTFYDQKSRKLHRRKFPLRL